VSKQNQSKSEMGEKYAKKYSGVVLVVTVFVCSEGRRGGEEASVRWYWYNENKKENKAEK